MSADRRETRAWYARRGWRVGLQLAVTTALLAWLWHVVDGPALLARLGRAHPGWVAAGLLLTAPNILIAALRWRFTARQVGAHIGLGAAVREFYMAIFLNQVLPGGMAGDAVRAWRHGRGSPKPLDDAPDDALEPAEPPERGSPAPARGAMGPAIRAVVIERIAGQVTLGASVLAGVAFWPTLPGALPGAHIWGPILAVLAVTGVAIVVIVLRVQRREGGIGVGHGDGVGSGNGAGIGNGVGSGIGVGIGVGDGVGIGAGIGVGNGIGVGDGVGIGVGSSSRIGALAGAIARAADRLLADSRRALFSRRSLGPQVLLALLVILSCLAVFYCGARAVHAPLSLFHLLILVPTLLLSMSIPISVGGWGLREATAMALWTMAGLPGEEALAASVAYGLINLLGSLPGALMLLVAR